MPKAPKGSAAEMTRPQAVQAGPVASSPSAGPASLVTINEVADHSAETAAPANQDSNPATAAASQEQAQKGIGDEVSEFLEMLSSDVLRAVHGLQANAEDLSRRLAVAGEMAAHSAMAEVATVVGEFRNGLHRIMAPKT